MSQGGIEAKIPSFQLRWCRPHQAMSFSRRFDSRGVVSREISGLQLSSPVKKLGQSQQRITRVAMFGVRFVIVVGVEASEGRSQAAKGTYQTQIRQAILGHQSEA